MNSRDRRRRAKARRQEHENQMAKTRFQGGKFVAQSRGAFVRPDLTVPRPITSPVSSDSGVPAPQLAGSGLAVAPPSAPAPASI